MIVERIPAGVYAANCYVVGCSESKKGVIIDPGGSADEVLKKVNKYELDIEYILLTHAHGDHIGGIIKIKEQLEKPIVLHKEDSELLLDSKKNLSNMMSIDNIEMEADKCVCDGDILNFGNKEIEIIHTPGHTPGGMCIKIDNYIFTGDTLFARSIGRTDLFGGSYEKLIKSIKEKLLVYDDEVKLLPGHGPATTIGSEKRENSFIK